LKGLRPILIVLTVLILDQVLKVWVKTNMSLGQEFDIASWFKIHFTENEGMAFGFSFGGDTGKLILSLFRVVAVCFITYYLAGLIKTGAKKGLIVAISLILAGALGNIVDSLVYGVLFSESILHGPVAEFMPEGGGYAPFLYGKVVDMFYFPLYSGFLPEWVPFWGGEYFEFFRPVFNIADASITSGVILIVLFQKSYFASKETAPASESEDQEIESNPV
jgi:signal peptidase II